MPSPDVCRVHGILYDASGDVRANVRITIRRTIKSGVLVSTRPVDYRTNDDGELVDSDGVTLGIPLLRDSVAHVDASAVGLDARPGTGVALTVPDAATANIEDLVPATSTAIPGVSQSTFNAHTELVAGPATLGHVMVPAENIDEDGLLIFSEAGGAWGSITGTLSNQTDLQTALSAKADLVGGVVPDNQIGAPIARNSEVDAAVAVETSRAQAAEASLAPLASPAFTGTPTAPTAAPGTNTQQLSTTAFVQAAIGALINSAPGALDTLDELAAALGDDANFAASVTTSLAGKQPLDAGLTSFALLATASDRIPYTTGPDVWAETPLTAFGRSLIDDANAAAGRTTLELGAANSPTFAGLTLSGLTVGSIPFAGSGGLLSQDNAKLFWDDTNDRLYIGTRTTVDSVFGSNLNNGIGVQGTIATIGDIMLRVPTSNRIVTLGPSGDIIRFREASVSGNIPLALDMVNNLVGVNKSTAQGAQLHVVANAAGVKGLIVSTAASPTQPIAEFQVNATMKSRVTKEGALATSVNAAPADADILTSEVQFWFDPTPGSAKVKFKGKDSAGTVVTGEVALA